MSLNVPGVGAVPIVWKPSPDHNRGRAGYQPIAIVHHRAVASTLNGIDVTFDATGGNTSRQVSANFAIGHMTGGKLEIHQYVDLSDTAWCNGIDPALVPQNNWTTWGYENHHHNARTVSIEHEDQGGSSDPAKKGIVREDILKTSIALDRLMLSGDIAAMRAAGIRIRDSATATALKKIPRDARHLIDHHDIAAQQKPYCWKPWKADKVGFPRARFVKELTAPPAPQPVPEVDMPPLVSPDVTGFAATVKATANIRSAPKIAATTLLRTLSQAEVWKAIGWVKGDVDPESGSDLWLMTWRNGRYEYTAKANLSAGPTAPPTYDQGYAAAKKKAGEAVAAI